MQKVNIYAETSDRYFGSRERPAGYVLELEKPDGETGPTRHEFYMAEGTYYEVIIEAILKAARRMKGEKCIVTVFSAYRSVLHMITDNLPAWRDNGFLDKHGERIRCADQWEELAGILDHYEIRTENETEEPHIFYNWMIMQMNHMAKTRQKA